MTETLESYTARVLTGSAVDAAEALRVAAGRAVADGVVAGALREGFSAPDRAPEPTLPDADEADESSEGDEK